MAPTETGTTRPEMQQVTKKKPRRGGGGSGGGRDRRTNTNDKQNGKKFDKKFRNKHDKHNKHNDKQNNKHSSKNFITTTGRRPRHDRLDISFDQVERKQYLTTLSSKKKDRRVFGLAMQKLKDRRARLDMRKEEREAQLEQVEEAERTKGRALVGFNGGECESSDDDDDDDNDNEDNEDGDSDGGEGMTEPLAISGSTNTITGDKTNLNTTTFQDEQTQSQFGGQVIVTTTFGGLSDDDDDDDENNNKNNGVDRPNAKHADVDQQYAGSVKKYMAQLKRNQPSKKHKRSQGGGTMAMGGKKGQHGAEGMKGMGNAKQLKMAQKILRGKQKRSGGGGAADGMIGKGKKKQRKK